MVPPVKKGNTMFTPRSTVPVRTGSLPGKSLVTKCVFLSGLLYRSQDYRSKEEFLCRRIFCSRMEIRDLSTPHDVRFLIVEGTLFIVPPDAGTSSLPFG